MAVQEEEWRKSIFHGRLLVQSFCDQIPFLSPTSAKDIHWQSSFLQLPTDSWVEFCTGAVMGTNKPAVSRGFGDEKIRTPTGIEGTGVNIVGIPR